MNLILATAEAAHGAEAAAEHGGGHAQSWTWWNYLGQHSEPLGFLDSVPQHVIAAWLVCIILCVTAAVVGRHYRNVDQALLPQGKLSFIGFIEFIAEGFAFSPYPVAENAIGAGFRKHMWLLGPLFFYLLFGNLFGLLPGFVPPTDQMSTNIAVGLVVFLAYNIAGLRENGLGYLRHFWAPAGLGVMGPFVGVLLLVVEGISHSFRPISLSLRLYGNISGDHLILSTFTGLVPPLVPVFFLTFGLLVALIQAFVFTLLSAVYIGLATAHDH